MLIIIDSCLVFVITTTMNNGMKCLYAKRFEAKKLNYKLQALTSIIFIDVYVQCLLIPHITPSLHILKRINLLLYIIITLVIIETMAKVNKILKYMVMLDHELMIQVL